jgi:hypothetical protein
VGVGDSYIDVDLGGGKLYFNPTIAIASSKSSPAFYSSTEAPSYSILEYTPPSVSFATSIVTH